MSKKVTPAEIAEMADLYRLHYSAGMTYAEIGKKVGQTANWVVGRVYRYRTQYSKEETPHEFQVVDLGQPLTLEGDWMIVGDVHVPTIDWGLAQLMVQVAKKHLTHPRLLIAGDFFSMDCFSNYPPSVAYPSWEQERKAGERLLKEWLGDFDEIVALMGNHDRRVVKRTDAAISGADVYRMLTHDPKLTVSNYGWCEINTPNGKYRVTHPTQYSTKQLVLADELALKFQCHTISFHEHHLGFGWDRYSRYLVVNGGGLFDSSQFAYVNLDDSKSPAMKSGFCLLKNGTPHLFGKAPFTDWSAWI
jgi:hypothetical protein